MNPWAVRAECKGLDPAMFFPERGNEGQTSGKDAKSICLVCLVRIDCLDFAIENDERLGIWGGMTYGERCLERSRRRNTPHNALQAPQST